MVIQAAMWIHGNSVRPENEGPFLNKVNIGWGARFNAVNGGNWFHFPFSSPVILNDVRPLLSKAFVFYKTTGDVKITNVHIYDGPTLLKNFDNLTLQGDHSTAIDDQNSWLLPSPQELKWGLGISVGVSFGNFANNTIPEILFCSAGVDLLKP
jgi:hypothetical protein